MHEFKRVLNHAWQLYTKKAGMVSIFALPLIAAFVILFAVPAPTYNALGSVIIRTGSIPEMDPISTGITILAYLVSIFIFADVITNINLIIKAKRTQNKIPKEILKAMGVYATKIFFVFVLIALLIFAVQLLSYGMQMQEIIYPFLSLIIYCAFFFVPPAIVIDNYDTTRAIAASFNLVLKLPLHLLAWILIGLISLSLVELVVFFIIPSEIGSWIVLLINSLYILPFLIILQSQIYMERYPLAR
ncbi:hypothetical protein JXB01_02370 [Candidatus Micrarchaeota archaeon]|nr:hypothetical protein [Candidatus Micrarchaeota archaeon]